MRLILAIIHPTKLRAVHEALHKMEVTRLTVCDAQGFGRQQRRLEWLLAEDRDPPLRKVVLEIMVNDDFLDRTIETIQSVARTGADGLVGDGKIFVLPADSAIQIDGTGSGPSAV